MSAFDGMPRGAPSNAWQAQELIAQLRLGYETLEASDAIASARKGLIASSR
jgi:hypothetical protein